MGEANRDQILICFLFVCCYWVLFVASVFLLSLSFVVYLLLMLLFVICGNFQFSTHIN